MTFKMFLGNYVTLCEDCEMSGFPEIHYFFGVRLISL